MSGSSSSTSSNRVTKLPAKPPVGRKCASANTHLCHLSVIINGTKVVEQLQGTHQRLGGRGVHEVKVDLRSLGGKGRPGGGGRFRRQARTSTTASCMQPLLFHVNMHAQQCTQTISESKQEEPQEEEEEQWRVLGHMPCTTAHLPPCYCCCPC